MNTLLLISVVLAAGGTGGGTGTSPPPAPNPDYVNQFAVEGAAALADGNHSMVFTLTEHLGGPTALALTLFTETQTVAVSGGRFKTRVGKNTNGGIPVETLAGHSRVSVRWAAAAAPSTSLGSQPYLSPPIALTLAPSATVEGGLTLTDSNVGLDAVSESKTAVQATASSTYGANAAIESVAASPAGAAVLVMNTSASGDLLQARNVSAGSTVFRVARNGDVYSAGNKVPQYGPKGSKGSTGDKGITGNRGADGNKGPPGDAASMTYSSVCVVGPSNCPTQCAESVVSVQVQATNGNGCYANSANGQCSTWTNGHWCCTCTP